MNIWSKNLQELHRVEEIFYKRSCSCVKIAFPEMLVCDNCLIFSERLCTCVKLPLLSEFLRSTGQYAQIEFLFFAKCSCKRLNSTFEISTFMAVPPCSLQKLC